MNRPWQRMGMAVAGVALVLWTLLAMVSWWGLNASAHWLDSQSAESVVQWVTHWTGRPWVQHWLDPHEIAALRDGVDWVFHLGGGPQAWLSSVVVVLKVLLVMTWAGGIVLSMLTLWVAQWALSRAAAWWQSGRHWPWQTDRTSVAPAVATDTAIR